MTDRVIVAVDEVLRRYATGQRLFRCLAIEGGNQSFQGAILDDVDFEGSFIVADFRSASLKRASFRQANLKTCDFRKADLRDANFSEAAICYTQFTGAKMDGASFEGAYYDSTALASGARPASIASPLLWGEGKVETAVVLDSYRPNSQDRAEVLHQKGGLVIALADGAGGISGGTEAADTVMMWVKAFVSGTHNLADPDQWRNLLARVDRQVEAEGGQTTAVVVAITDAGIVGASVGDSAAWLIGSDGCRDLTEHQVRKPLLGAGDAQPVAFETKAMKGTLLVASDGLVKYAPRDRICAGVLEPYLPAAGKKIVDLARLRSGTLQDDVALVLYRMGVCPR